MSCPITNTLKTYALAVLMILITGLPLGNVNSSFAETPTDVDIEMWIDTSETFGDVAEAEIFNNVLNVFVATLAASGGDFEVVGMDPHTICISAHTGSGSCSSNVPPPSRHLATDVESHNLRMTIISADDQ